MVSEHLLMSVCEQNNKRINVGRRIFEDQMSQDEGTMMRVEKRDSGGIGGDGGLTIIKQDRM